VPPKDTERKRREVGMYVYKNKYFSGHYKERKSCKNFVLSNPWKLLGPIIQSPGHVSQKKRKKKKKKPSRGVRARNGGSK
jgi:hypothetical protein